VNEFELIERLSRRLPSNDSLVTGAGDDCAVLDLGLPDRYVLFKTDAVVEGIHFTRETPPQKIGHKALARCLSDIAAMAGAPSAALITLALPAKSDVAFIEGIYEGIGTLARRYSLAVAGGETTTNPERILISMSVIGTVNKTRCIHRSGAKSGDAIFVTGHLGGSLSAKHLDFEPRLAEGLAGDLRHILRSSGVGAELLSESIPISRAARLQARTESSTRPPLLAALTDGEDFELLFTIASRDAVPLLDAWKKQFPELLLTCIGKITATPGLKLRDKEGLRELTLKGYEHFSTPPQSQ